MRRVTEYILIAIALLVVVGVYMTLTIRQDQLNDRITYLEHELQGGAQDYTRCYYSIHNGGYMVDDVSFRYLQYNSTDEQKARLEKLESSFMKDVKKKCDPIVTDYESKFVEYKRSVEESMSSGWISFLFGGSRPVNTHLDELDSIRFQTGDALSYFVFTKKDVESYFVQHLQ